MRTVSLKLVLAWTVLLTGLQAGDAQSPTDGRLRVSVSTGSTNGAWYLVTSTEASAMKKSNRPFEIVPVTSQGAIDNVTRVNKGEVNFGVSNGDYLLDAWDKKSERNVRIVGPHAGTGLLMFQMVVLAKSNIKQFSDLNGKRIGIQPPGAAGFIFSKQLVELSGLKIDMVPLSTSELPTRLRDGDVEAILSITSAPNPTFEELAGTLGIRLVDLGPELDRVKWFEKNPDPPRMTIPANTYKGQSSSVTSFGSPTFYVTNATQPDDVVTRFIKEVYEPAVIEDLKKSHPSAGAYMEAAAKHPFDVLPVPLHPAAEKLWRARGATIPASMVK